MSREVVPASHEPRPVHVDERDGDPQVLADEVVEEVGVRETVASLVQVVDVRVTRVPAHGRRIDKARQSEACLRESPGRHVHRELDRPVLQAPPHGHRRLARGHFHLEGAAGSEVVRLGWRQHAVKAPARCVATAIRRGYRDAGGGRAPALVEHRAAQRPDGCTVRAVAHIERPP